MEMDILVEEYISREIERLANNNTCCIHCFGPFCSPLSIVVNKVTNLSLNSQIYVINGNKVTKIYKPHCNHSIHQPSNFQLSEQSKRDILHYLKRNEYDGPQQDTLISAQIFRPSRFKPVLPPNRFTIGPVRQSIYQSNGTSKEILHESWRLFPHKATILQKISNNRVLVINGDVSLEKSTAIPMFIVEDSSAKGTYCKILCVESDNLSAITHCTVLTKHIKERIGSRVGFQVHLQSRVCDNTNLIYTTSAFFLRVLMGQNSNDSFRHISHIVVSDVHLHHAYTDILLHELRNILPHFSQIKIILLSDSNHNGDLLSYFGEGSELQLNLKMHNVKLYYMEEVNIMVENEQKRLSSLQFVGDILPNVVSNDNANKEWADRALEQYESTGSDSALNNFLYLVDGENVSINYIHPVVGTALIMAAKRGNSLHLSRLLTYENVNPFLQDNHKFNALEYAISNNSTDCARSLFNYMKQSVNDCKPSPIDFRLIEKLVQLLTTNWKFGHILIFLPKYEDLLKLSYGIIKLQFIGKIPQKISIHMLHPNMQYDQVQPIIEESSSVKVILSTELAESLAYLNDITYVIDYSQNCIEKYDPKSKCKNSTNEWASKENLQRRTAIASRFTTGHCFRIMPRRLFSKLQSFSSPELLYMPMNRISLTAKLLCPHKTVAEYLKQTIVRPPLVHVLHSIEFLKKIEVFDCMEDVTWLGCRLIDVPVNLELGKSLVLSILLKCLDPVLTIVSFLTCSDLRDIARSKSCIAKSVHHNKRDNILLDFEGSYSDHLTLLRLYQVWQNDKRENTVNGILSDVDTYVINGILDKVCGIRTHLVGALRSSQLIHNQGQLSMHSINSKANNWAIIKAALVGGLYPRLCMIDRSDYQLKSNSRNLCIHPSSTLQDIKSRINEDYPSNWIVFFRETNNTTMNSISNCTLISPITVALFAGKTELAPENIINYESPGYAAYYVDEWIWLTTDINSAILLYKLRQRFNTVYLDFLQTCGNIEKWRKSNALSDSGPRIFDLISNIILEEDMNNGFAQPIRVGNRPKAVASKFTSDFDIDVNPRAGTSRRKADFVLTRLIENRCLDKEFFLISVFDSHEIMKSFGKLPMFDISTDPFFDLIRTSVSDQKLTYVIMYNLNRKRFTNVGLVKCYKGGYFLRNCFQIDVPVYEVIIVCTTYKIHLPSFKPDWKPLKLDNSIGEIILDLF